jgi:hypothetical protein
MWLNVDRPRRLGEKKRRVVHGWWREDFVMGLMKHWAWVVVGAPKPSAGQRAVLRLCCCR